MTLGGLLRLENWLGKDDPVAGVTPFSQGVEEETHTETLIGFSMFLLSSQEPNNRLKRLNGFVRMP